MKKGYFYLFLSLLAISLCCNIAFYSWKNHWKRAWANQLITTYNIEKILQKAGDDFSYDNIKGISMQFYKSSFAEISVNAESLGYEVDQKAIRVDNTILLFKSDIYAGSKSINE